MTTTPNTVQQLAARWLQFLEEDRGLAPSTIRMYRSTVRAFGKDFTELENLTAEDVQEWVRRPRRNKMPSASTRRRDLVTLKEFFRWTFAHRYVDIRVQDLLVMPRTHEGVPRPIPDAMWNRLWQSDMALDDRVWLGLGYFLGLRRYEIVTMSPETVDPAQGMLVNFRRKGGKTKVMEYRAVCSLLAHTLPHISEGIWDWANLLEDIASARHGEKHLSVFSHADDPFLDGNRLTKRMTKVLLPGAGLPPSALTPHQLRHSCATNLWRAGMSPEDIRRHMSHSTMATTEGYMDSSGYMSRIIEERGIKDGHSTRATA